MMPQDYINIPALCVKLLKDTHLQIFTIPLNGAKFLYFCSLLLVLDSTVAKRHSAHALLP